MVNGEWWLNAAQVVRQFPSKRGTTTIHHLPFTIRQRMIIGKSKKEIEKMRAAGRLVAQVREGLRLMARPGVTTLELDRAAEKMIRDAGALPTFKGYHGFPYLICASVNAL